MPANHAEAHVYHRHISPNERTSLSIVAATIQPQSRVLDLGVGSGALGKFLSTELNCLVDGVTYNPQEAEIAAPFYRRLVVADLDSCDLVALFPTSTYSYIVCADVLEHIKEISRTLEAIKRLLLPEGKLIVSVPNASYCGLVAELMHGDFRYRSEGLLDATHLKFFTQRSLLRFLHEHDWFIESVEPIERQLNESEFQIEFDQLPPSVARYLLAMPEALTYQMVVTATPALGTQQCSSGLVTDQRRNFESSLHAVFSAQLYWGIEGDFDEKRKIVVAGQIGEHRQWLNFRIPSSPAPITGLRLDPADRPGFLYLYSIKLCQASGATLWSWTCNSSLDHHLLSAPTQEMLHCLDAPGREGVLFAMYGDDPWIELPIPAKVLSEASEGELLVELGWPMSADYVAIKKTVARLQSQKEEPIVTPQQPLHTTNDDVEQILLLERQILALTEQSHHLSNKIEQMERSVAMRLFKPFYVTKYWIKRWLGIFSNDESNTVVDVIVPVYTGLSDTRRCIQSVLSSNSKTPYRLIVINDASPEPAITSWLQDIASKEPRIYLLENARNLGFVASVNRGMRFSSTNDVILLNSDTEVANDWIDRLRAAAYSDRRIASVTPFSNNATICSYPQFCAVNPEPDISTAALDLIFADCNKGQVIDVPTGVGFCMYLRRACLSEIGLFDVENFGKGYGEENDFCVRANDAGWRNIHALDVYVLHAGGVSFGESKASREQAAMLTLRRLHPNYEPNVHSFIERDPAREARLRVERIHRK